MAAYAHLSMRSMHSIQFMQGQPNTMVGIHPEASRNKKSDPYSFLRTRSGIGQVLQNCPDDTLILPYFMCGLSSNFLKEVQRNFRLDPAARGEKIRITFGKPFFASTLERTGKARDLAEHLMEIIKGLAAEDQTRKNSDIQTPHAA